MTLESPKLRFLNQPESKENRVYNRGIFFMEIPLLLYIFLKVTCNLLRSML